MSERVDVRKNLRIALQHVLICGPDAFVQAAIEQADDAVAELVERAKALSDSITFRIDDPRCELHCKLVDAIARFGGAS